MKDFLFSSVFFGVFISLFGYEVGVRLKKKFGWAILNPLLIAIIIVIAALSHAESTLRKTQGVRVLGRYAVTLSGQKCAIWMMENTPTAQTED